MAADSDVPADGAQDPDQTGGTRRPQGPGALHDRHVFGPRSLGAVLPGVVRPAFRKRAPATAQIIADWDSIVGPMIGRLTTPRRLSAGTLSIGCNGPVALELQHLSDALIERINTHVGHTLVQRLRFVQEAADAPAPTVLRPPADPRALQAVDRAVSDFPEGPLREALAALGRALARGS